MKMIAKTFLQGLPACAVVAVGMLAGTDQASADVTQVAPHQAYYEVKIADPASGISLGGGYMLSELVHSCDGWTLNQRLLSTLQAPESPEVDMEVVGTSFESNDGTKYQFAVRTIVNGDVVLEVRGKAERPARSAPGVAVYAVPAGKQVKIPANTFFPIGLVLATLPGGGKNAVEGIRPYFDGLRLERTSSMMNTLLLGKSRPSHEGVGANLDDIAAQEWWPIRSAAFAADKTQSGALFESTAHTQANGVTRWFTFEDNEVDMEGALVRIEELERAQC